VAKDELHRDAGGSGLLVAFREAGAVLAAFGLTSAYRRLSLRRWIVMGAVAFAGATLTAGVARDQWLVCAMLLLARMGWMAV
ncbi:MFS transporter, partial [Pseudomonas aeruginosa]